MFDGARSTPTRGWLPPATQRLSITKPLSFKFVKTNKSDNWFLSLEWAMSERTEANPAQGRVMTKVYLFLRNYLPEGFTGPYAHIQGNDIIDYLLCYTSKQAVSRHKVSRDADAAFAVLGLRMKKGITWKQALESPTHDSQGKQACFCLMTL